jgi:hypothetical protein
MSNKTNSKEYLIIVAAFLIASCGQASAATTNQAPIADAGLSRYAAYNPVVLDGTGSYDADNSGPLTYTWRQIGGPPMDIIDANTAIPTIGRSIQIGTERQGLIAHWALDETEGSIAYDSAGAHDGTLNGDPVWQPAGGQIDGALAFDGTDDYVSTDFVLNPADGPFSIFAWIKEDAPGQVIISQADRTIFGTTISTGSAWLSTDPAEGKLMTKLQGLDQAGGPLASQTVVTDGGWHRVGLTWDSYNRILYVDDVEVARDTQPQFGSSRAGLNIGAGNNLEPGSFFSGLIDDVRIYDRALTTFSGFFQTSEIQECEFELVVSDGELTSPPDTVKVIIVPDFGTSNLTLWNPPFDPGKPTIIAFGGANQHNWKQGFDYAPWDEKANFIVFNSYSGLNSKRGDMIIVYLSSQAPDYKQPIQTMGQSAGGAPAIDVGIHLNETYRDPRYAVNRVTFLDPGDYSESDYRRLVERFQSKPVDGEQCWVDGYDRWYIFPNALNVQCPSLTHAGPKGVRRWYEHSLTHADMNQFNGGVIAGAYWSVAGPGKNLQLATQADAYYFRWDGNVDSGQMSLFDEAQHPGRLPEPVTLVGPVDVGDPSGVLLTCEESENAIGYQLLFGPNPYRVMDYNIISDTPAPPNEVITTLPFEETWWTVKVYDQYGSTIYADPIYIDASMLSFPIAGN